MPVVTTRVIGRRHRPIRIWESREQFFTELGLFILGAAGAYSVNLVGSLPGDELILIPALPVLLLTKGRRAFRREYLWFYILAGAWLFGTVFGDIYLGSPATSRIKGAARVVFFVFDFMALAILINNKTRRVIVFALSIVAVMLMIMRQFRGEFLTQWKFGGSSSVTMLALLLSSYFYARRKYWVCIGIAFAIAGLNLILAFRSQIGIDLVSLALILPIFSQTRASSSGRPSRLRNSLKLIVLLTLAGGAAFLANQAIKFAAGKGLFEESVSQKFETQSGGRFGVLVGGRPETLVAIQAIRDSPIIGHGSFAVDPKYLELKQDIQYEYGYANTDDPEDSEEPTIPTHSHLTMAWVESGILGGLLWMYLLVLTIRGVLVIPFLRPNFAPLYCYMLMNFVWDIVYSPFGNVNRIWAAYTIIICYFLLKTPAPNDRSSSLPRRRPPYGSNRIQLTGRVPRLGRNRILGHSISNT
jgi:O-antigen ligase